MSHQKTAARSNGRMTYAYDDVTYAYDDVTYAYDDVTYAYDDVTYAYALEHCCAFEWKNEYVFKCTV